MSALGIRRFCEQDREELCALLADAEVMRYLEPPFTREQVRAFMDSCALCEPPRVLAAEAKGEFIGYVIFHPYAEHSYELGWVLKRSAWGQGYADALISLLEERAKGLTERLVIECVPEQTATIHIARKHGFTLHGEDGLLVFEKQLGET